MDFRKTLMLLVLAATAAMADLEHGDIAFTGYNADDPDGVAFVALVDIPANTRIYFCDANWDGTKFPTNEGDWSWSQATTLSAGTVVRFTGVGTVGFAVNTGTIVHNNSGGLSTSSEAVYAFTVAANPDSVRLPDVFLAAITNNNFGADPGVLTGTGLVQDSTAIRLTPTADAANYTGMHNAVNKAGLLAMLADMSNWTLLNTAGNDNQTLSTLSFTYNPPVNVSRGSSEAIARSTFAVRLLPGREALLFNRATDFELTDLFGRTVRSGKAAESVDLKGLARGRYFLSVPGEKAIAVPVTR